MDRLRELGDRIAARDVRIGVIGLGYVGLPLALEFAKRGFRVTGFDVNRAKVEALQKGDSYIEDVPAAEVAGAIREKSFSATTDFGELSRCDVINVCVPTPLTRSKDPDVSHMASAMEEIRKRLRSGQLIVLGSTTYPGTTHELFVPMLESTGLRVGHDFALAFAPERIDPANRQFKVREVPKVVGGETALCCELARQLFETIFDKVVPVSSTQSAEMVKLLENTFRAINIGLVNEVAMMCDRLQLDVWEVIEAAATKPFGFMRFDPGPGMGGHCLPVDPFYLAFRARQLDFYPEFIELAGKVNQAQPGFCVERIERALNGARKPVNGSRILILGVAYKGGVGDTRESPALKIVERLQELGGEVSYHDAFVPELAKQGLSSVELEAALRECDLAAIVTAHPGVDWADVVAKAPLVVDFRGVTREIEADNLVRL